MCCQNMNIKWNSDQIVMFLDIFKKYLLVGRIFRGLFFKRDKEGICNENTRKKSIQNSELLLPLTTTL